ncbi:carbohydrate ABC transporter permease [Alicyclobacillus fodiniaquatilis]|jgi:putative chitobiose transport system permease protein|uniref:Carbohydrate ABC transporter permease n=1 Tax=Alicyclobacillus fodiniaquatilis TaxID=1661150 RepID=A0ABW4JGJ2_9BACL
MRIGLAANSSRIFVSYLFMALGTIVFLFPLVWLLATSFMSPNENPFSVPPHLIPKPVTLSNYVETFKNYSFGRYLWNSFYIAVVSVVLNIVITLMTAYPLARMKFRGRRVVMGLIIATLVLPGEGTLVPRYLLTQHLHLINTYWGIIIPGMFSAFSVFLLYQSFDTISKELDESARIDGAGDMRIFIQILTPLVGPTLAALAIMGFLGSWDSFLWPLIVLNNSNLYTAPLGLDYFFGTFGASWSVAAAASVLVAAPVVIVFLAMQRWFVNGVAGAFKG